MTTGKQHDTPETGESLPGGGGASASRTPVQIVGLFLGPVAAITAWLALAPAVEGQQARMMAVVVLMAIWWMTEAIPLAATSLVPFVVFPLLGIAAPGEVASSYINPIIFLFLGGFFIALAMERWQLHRRIALAIIDAVGSEPRRIVLGFLLAAGFLSMWLSNTATAVMMLPIGLAIVLKVEDAFGVERCRGLSLSLMLAIAYGASIGGVATLVGTPPNLVFARVYASSFPEAASVTFGQWILFGVPFAVVMLALVWLMLTRFLCRVDPALRLDAATIRDERKGLGAMSYEEKIVAAVFCLTAALWVFRSDLTLGFVTIPGWARLWAPFAGLHDGTIAIAMALLLFVIPQRGGFRNGAILENGIISKAPWGIVLLFGGGFALADGFVASGLSEWLAGKFTGLEGTPAPFAILMVSTGINFLTELTSNTATTQMILPLLASMSAGLGVHPLPLMIAGTLSASMAFMMPVATPPNAIVFGSGRIRMGEMVRIGILINLVSIAVTFAVVWFFLPLIFDMTVMPRIAR